MTVISDTVTYRLYDVPRKCAAVLVDAVSGALQSMQASYAGFDVKRISDHGRPARLIIIKVPSAKEWYATGDILFRRRIGDAIAGARFHILL